MKKTVLFSVLLLSGSLMFAQAPTTIVGAIAKPDAKRITMAQQGGPAGANAHYNMGPPAMNPADFRMACDAISRQPFDSDKMRIAAQVLSGHNISSLQGRDMAKLFTFESYRVDFAKAAYTKVIDPQNYYVVNDAFTFSSSIAEVVNYTNSVGYAGGGTWTSSNGGSNGGGGYGGGNGGGYGGGNGHGNGSGYGGGNGSGHGHGGSGSGHGGGHGHNGGHNHAGPCSSACGANSGGGYGQNGFYGGQCGVTPGFGNGMNSVPMCGMCSGYHAMNIVCEREFGSIANAIANRTFESDKILVAKQAIGGKLVSADQVRRLMGLFTFESTKLDFAKWAYHTTIDPQNYYIVNDAFTFSSSIRDLDEFIRRS